MGKRAAWMWWLALVALWLGATAADRLWLAADQRLPAWDQADYLNSAVDHGRALGLLAGGGWQGWQALLDLSPKIPPLAALVSGSVMALAGESADAASWSLSLWHGVLLLVVALWGRQLLKPAFGLLAAALVALAPALAALRVDFTLEVPLTAATTLALWQLWRWQRPAPHGGTWAQAMGAGLAIAMALLIKQSALLVLAPPALWGLAHAQKQSRRRWQSWGALVLVLVLLLPWLQHNWITTLGGTERAVVTSGAAEGDPGSLDPRSLIWYPRLWAAQLGGLQLGIGLGGLLLLGWRQRGQWLRSWPSGWLWLLGCTISGWLCTSLSPNKDPRYIAPVLPLLALLLARGWWTIGLTMQHRLGRGWSAGLLAAALLGAGLDNAQGQARTLLRRPNRAVPDAVAALRHQLGDRQGTVLITASMPDLNEHTLTFLGRQNGGQLLARRLGRNPGQEAIALDHADWWILASGDQGSKRRSARALSQQVRRDGRFEQLQSWPWSEGRRLELWRRRSDAPKAPSFDQPFIALAGGMSQGPRGLAPVFAAIGPWHLVDPQFLYQQRVQRWAARRLAHDGRDREALWAQALIATLRNRPKQAAFWYQRLESRTAASDPAWPANYRAVVLLADWNPLAAQQAARQAQHLSRDADSKRVAAALEALSATLSGQVWRLPDLARRLPAAVETVEEQLSPP